MLGQQEGEYRMKKTATAFAILVGLSASSVSAQVVVGPNDLQGSDTMFNITNKLTSKLGIAPANLTYVGGGSGTGTAAMSAATNRQEIAPSSRFFSTSECGSANVVAGKTRGYAVAGDAIINVASATGPACTSLAWDQSVIAQDLNGTAGIQGSASTTLPDWRTVMRIIYSGRVDAGSGAAQDCNSDLRHTLVKNWNNIFKGGCSAGTCTAGLSHAYRRDDLSGTTDTYLELLQLPRFTSVPAPTVSPFCNGFDSQDNDPIRRTCAGTGFGGNGDEVCGLGSTANAADPRNQTLGVVLPILVPQENAYGQASTPPASQQNCGTSALGGAASGSVAWGLPDSSRYGARCPNGAAPVGGTCKWPKRAGSAAGQGFGCIAARNDRPAGSPSSVDGRIYNLYLRSGSGTVLTYQRSTAAVRAISSYYRARQVGGCNKADATDQIACLVTKDQCSIGFAGIGALATTGTKSLGIRSLLADGAGGSFVGVTPPALNAADRVAQLARYPLSRNLYMLTYDEFTSTGAQPAAFVTAQQQIWAAVTGGAPAVAESVSESGFYTLPTPYVAETCN
ncbi:MAG: hypothetical protein RL385_1710 [Pseudomonadota bacterium]